MHAQDNCLLAGKPNNLMNYNMLYTQCNIVIAVEFIISHHKGV